VQKKKYLSSRDCFIKTIDIDIASLIVMKHYFYMYNVYVIACFARATNQVI